MLDVEGLGRALALMELVRGLGSVGLREVSACKLSGRLGVGRNVFVWESGEEGRG